MRLSTVTPVLALVALMASDAGAVERLQSQPESIAQMLSFNPLQTDALKSADRLTSTEEPSVLAMRKETTYTFETGSTIEPD